MKPPANLEITLDEQELIQRGTESEEFVQTPVWMRIEKELNAIVEDALDGMRGNVSADPMVGHRLNLIWREREAFRDKLILFVKGPIRAKKELLQQIEEEKKYGRSAY
jgi:hypothetical protein